MDGEGGAPRSKTAARAKASRGWGTRRSGLLPPGDCQPGPSENRSSGGRERGSEGGFFFGKDQASRPCRRYTGNPGDDRVRRAVIDLRPEAVQPVD